VSLTIREARADDLEGIVRLFLDDDKGGHGDRWDEDSIPAYRAAMAEILASPANTLFVAVEGGRVVGTYQLTITPGLVGRGRKRATAESVHVASDRRGQGIGAALMADAVARASAAGCGIIQLSSNKARTDAHRFYRRLGFAQSHEGFKRVL
jgi:GNAT superfamily N-acetyltransferase